MNRDRKSVLDLIRALAALEVVASHLQVFCFDFSRPDANPHDQNLWVRLFYYGTFFGHQAVTVFFVLSGYFVGGSVIASDQRGFWSRYLVQRLSRLWMVLIPCLVMTLGWDLLGYHTGGRAYLDGAMNPPLNSAPRGGPVNLGWRSFLANAFFLTIWTPCYGDNGPLWSLAWEFMYYLQFPLIYWGLNWRTGSAWWWRALQLLAAATLISLQPLAVSAGFLIWLCGVGAAVVQNGKWRTTFAGTAVGLPCLAGFLLMLHFSHYRKESDLVKLGIGLPLAAALPFILRVLTPGPLLARAGIWFSNFSYTLYLAHFPFAAFVWYTFFHARRNAPHLAGFLAFGLTFVLVLVYSYGLFLLFENNTDKIRPLLARCWKGAAKKAGSGS